MVRAQTENVIILSHNAWVTSDGSFVIAGEVQNVDTTILKSVRVQATFYNKTGEVIDYCYSDGISVFYIHPQEKAPFKIIVDASHIARYFPGGNASSIHHYALDVVSAMSTKFYNYHDFEFLDSSGYLNETLGLYVVSGHLKNAGNLTAITVRVLVTYYNASGDVVDAKDEFTSPWYNIAPSQTVSFEVASTEPSFAAQITSYALMVQDAGPTIPEFPVILAFAAFLPIIAVAAIFFRRKIERNNVDH